MILIGNIFSIVLQPVKVSNCSKVNIVTVRMREFFYEKRKEVRNENERNRV